MHESFAPRYSWLSKAVQIVTEDPGAFAKQDATVTFGVGKNMVNSIRYWSQAFKLLTKEGKSRRVFLPTSFGKALLGEDGWDPWLEDPASWWLLHWKLLSSPCRAPVWFYAFNLFGGQSFSQNELIEEAYSYALKVYSNRDSNPPTRNTVAKDVRALIGAYCDTPPDAGRSKIFSPLMELNLIHGPDANKRFHFRPGSKHTLTDELVGFAVCDYILRRECVAGEISFRRLADEPGSPGKVLKLSINELVDRMSRLMERFGGVEIVSPTRVPRLKWSTSLEVLGTNLLDHHYGGRLGPALSVAGPIGDLPARAALPPAADCEKKQLPSPAQSQPLSEVSPSLRTALRCAEEKIAHMTLADMLALIELRPLPAARHSVQNHRLTIFARRIIDRDTDIKMFDPFSPFDGELLLVVGKGTNIPQLIGNEGYYKPTIVAIPPNLGDLELKTRKLAALTLAKQSNRKSKYKEILELEELIADRREDLRLLIDQLYFAEDTEWLWLAVDGNHKSLPAGPASSALSAAADRAYPQSPQIKNEMINQFLLSSNIKSARCKLIEGLLEANSQPTFGINGYGPEVAIYKAIYAYSGMHAPSEDGETWIIQSPTRDNFQPLWQSLDALLDTSVSQPVEVAEVYYLLMSSPYGVKKGLIPLLLTPSLLLRPDLQVCKDGVQQPLSANLIKEMDQNPFRFTITSIISDQPPPPLPSSR